MGPLALVGSVVLEKENSEFPPAVISLKFDIDVVSLFNSIPNFDGYLMPKPFAEKNGSGTI